MSEPVRITARASLIGMADEQRLLLIADISGYTPFMRLHAMGLAHAQDIINDLIDGLIDASGAPFKLCKIEGDAAFLHAPISAGDDLSWLLASVERMNEAFHAMRRDVAKSTVCVCDACTKADELRVKFVAHVGPVHVYEHRGVEDLGGFAVIVVHRMLKVSVPAPEYLLVSESIRSRQAASGAANCLEVDFPEVGRMRLGYVELSPCRDSATAPLSSWLRWRISLKRTWRTLPGILGLKKTCEGFRNVPDAAAVAR